MSDSMSAGAKHAREQANRSIFGAKPSRCPVKVERCGECNVYPCCLGTPSHDLAGTDPEPTPERHCFTCEVACGIRNDGRDRAALGECDQWSVREPTPERTNCHVCQQPIGEAHAPWCSVAPGEVLASVNEKIRATLELTVRRLNTKAVALAASEAARKRAEKALELACEVTAGNNRLTNARNQASSDDTRAGTWFVQDAAELRDYFLAQAEGSE